eukprot:284814838_4
MPATCLSDSPGALSNSLVSFTDARWCQVEHQRLPPIVFPSFGDSCISRTFNRGTFERFGTLLVCLRSISFVPRSLCQLCHCTSILVIWSNTEELQNVPKTKGRKHHSVPYLWQGKYRNPHYHKRACLQLGTLEDVSMTDDEKRYCVVPTNFNSICDGLLRLTAVPSLSINLAHWLLSTFFATVVPPLFRAQRPDIFSKLLVSSARAGARVLINRCGWQTFAPSIVYFLIVNGIRT